MLNSDGHEELEDTKRESISRRWTDNTMAEIKRTKEQTTGYKTLHTKLEQHESH
jgi:hypothetical protein